MTASAEARLAELGLTLPTPMAPLANYVPCVVTPLARRFRATSGAGRADRLRGQGR